MQFLKDALFVAEQFFNEKKPGQYPSDVLRVQTFAAIALNNPVESQVYEQLRLIVTNPRLKPLMVAGLITKPRDRLQPGEFFRTPGITISILHESVVYDIGIGEMLKSISDHAKRTDNLAKGQQVALFVSSSLAQMFTTYLTNAGTAIGIERRERDALVGATVIEPIAAPYSQGQRMAALKNVLADGLATPAIRGFVDQQFGAGAVRIVEGAIKNFDGSTVGGLQAGLAQALATQKAGPIYDAVMAAITSTAGNLHADDKVKAYDQE